MGNLLKDIIKQKVRKLALAIRKSTQRGYFTESMSAMLISWLTYVEEGYRNVNESIPILMAVAGDGGVPHNDKHFSGYQLGVLQFKSILRLSTQRQYQVNRSVLQDCLLPHFTCQSQTQAVTCASD